MRRIGTVLLLPLSLIPVRAPRASRRSRTGQTTETCAMAETTHHFYKADPPDCPTVHCADVSPEIHKFCHQNNWPPGQKILVCDPKTGECCYCHC